MTWLRISFLTLVDSFPATPEVMNLNPPGGLPVVDIRHAVCIAACVMQVGISNEPVELSLSTSPVSGQGLVGIIPMFRTGGAKGLHITSSSLS